MRRPRLERAIRDAGFPSNEEFGRAIGLTGRSVASWIRCETSPGRDSRLAISEALELSPGADCADVAESDLDWLLEPLDEIACLIEELELCEERCGA